LRRILLTCLLLIVLSFSLAPSAYATDLANGATVFQANCAACHLGGRNVVNATKTLQKSDLEKYDLVSLEAIQAQVRNGKNAMPAFKGRLKEQQIEDVAAYVLDQAEKGWKS
jgi:cytochrome c6